MRPASTMALEVVERAHLRQANAPALRRIGVGVIEVTELGVVVQRFDVGNAVPVVGVGAGHVAKALHTGEGQAKRQRSP